MSEFNSRRSCELLAPAGDRECLRAAIENGADAIYFGLDTGFNARARAKNFAVEDVPEIVAMLHRRGVKAYVTVNTLAFPGELAEVERLVRSLAAAGVDAVLVQDIGVARLVKAICPELAIHASTQMTLTSAECIAVAEQLGIERVVLARELSVREIKKIAAGTTMPLEVFVHGALCVAYSGQCLTSESLGGRSANRGQCAQACRLPYEVLQDGEKVELDDVRYLLSPQDLAAYALVPELIAAGVCSLKIEGRLKTPEYVANITRHYRTAIDAALAGKPVKFSPRDIEEMELSFSRGFSPGWLRGCDHKMLVPGTSSSKRGVLLGTVRRVERDHRGGQRVLVELAASVKRGDGVMFDCSEKEDERQGGRVYEVFRDGRSVEEPVARGIAALAFAREAIDWRRIEPGQQLWKTDDPELTGRLRKSFTGADPLRRTPVDLTIEAAVGSPLRVRAVAVSGESCWVESEESLAAAMKHALSADVLREQFGRLGGSPYELRELDAQIEGAPMVPLSVIGKMRREMLRLLDEAAATPPVRKIAEEAMLPRLRETAIEENCRRRILSPNESLTDADRRKDSPPKATDSPPTGDAPPTIRVLCRSLAQLDAVMACGVGECYADFQDIREYGEAVKRAHTAGAKLFLATPRIQKPDEMGIFRALAKHGADGMLVRNLAGLEFYASRGVDVVADFSLNATNELSAAWLRARGAMRLTASYDLNRDQLLDLVAAVPAAWLEIVVHQHMPMFHMEHCVFCAVLSPGTDKTNCGRPCDRHVVHLRDHIGMEHPLTADVGCRNTLFNAVPQSAAEVVPVLIERGLRDFRIELLADKADDIARTIRLYRELLAGRTTGQAVWRELRAANRVGVTRGTLEERRNPLAII
jgi:putative protease